MEIVLKFFYAWCLVATTVIIHCYGLSRAIGPALRSGMHIGSQRLAISWNFVWITWNILMIHLLEISLWAFFYWWQQCMPDLESAFYFSGVTYATVGYGDLVLSEGWRLFGPVEGLTGILMCGLSTGFFFALVHRVAMDRFSP